MPDTSPSTSDAPSTGHAAVSGTQLDLPVNMYESESAVVIVAPLPGVMPDNVEVVLGDGRLTIRASMRSAAPKDYLLHEWHYGPFERTVQLPEGYGGDATTSFGNGQLAISVHKGPGTGERTISVS